MDGQYLGALDPSVSEFGEEFITHVLCFGDDGGSCPKFVLLSDLLLLVVERLVGKIPRDIFNYLGSSAKLGSN